MKIALPVIDRQNDCLCEKRFAYDPVGRFNGRVRRHSDAGGIVDACSIR